MGWPDSFNLPGMRALRRPTDRQMADNWMETAASYARDISYYQGLLDKIAKSIGETAYIRNDGSRSDESPVRANLPILVKNIISEVYTLRLQWARQQILLNQLSPGEPASTQ
jgi:hypothetical protein